LDQLATLNTKPHIIIIQINPLTLTVTIWAQLCPEHQSAWMSKITNDGLTRSGAGCFIAVPMWQQ